MTHKKYLIGLGNYAQTDDGIGLHIIEHIVQNNLDQGFEAIEIGNDGMQLLTYFTEKTAKIVIVDTAFIDKQPGEYLVIDPSDIESKKVVNKVTTHEGDVLKLIELGKQLDYPIPEIRILAIQPQSIEMKMGLSEILQSKLEQYVQTCIELMSE